MRLTQSKMRTGIQNKLYTLRTGQIIMPELCHRGGAACVTVNVLNGEFYILHRHDG